MRRLSLVTFIAFCLLTGCDKNGFGLTDRSEPDADAALLKVAVVSAPAIGYNVTIFMNGQRMSYPLATNLGTTTSTPFPGGGLGTGGSNNSDYMIVKPGLNQFTFNVLQQGTATVAFKLFETEQTLESGKRQTLFVADTGAATTAFLINVDGVLADSGSAKIKVVNAIPNVTTIDLYRGTSNATAVKVASGVTYKSATDYIVIPIGTGADSLFVRPSESAPTVAPIGRGRIIFANQRLYTVFARGYNGTVAPRAPVISAIINQ